MAKKPKHYVLNPETGYYSVAGQDVHIKVGTGSAVANTALLIGEVIKSPLTINVVVPPKEDDPGEAIKDPAARVAGRWFGVALYAVIALTFLTLIAVFFMAGTLTDHPTAYQAKAFDISVNAFWACVGVLIGIVTGKMT
jgi:hypothetical protein